MKENNAEEKTKKKITKKRKFYSAPNLGFGETRVKATDMFLVSPNDIRKYQKDLLANVTDDKTKKTKRNKKAQAKKVNDKNVDKILLEPVKGANKTKKNSDDYQWLVKKNIIKMMGGEKKKIPKECVAGTSETKTKRAGSVKKKQPETSKKIKEVSKNKPGKVQDPTRSRKFSRKDDEVKVVSARARPNTASLIRRSEVFPTQRAQTTPVIHKGEFFNEPQGKTAMILHPTPNPQNANTKKFKMQKLRDIFNVFKPKEGSAPENLFLNNELQKIRKKLDDAEKKKQPTKKKKAIAKAISSTIKLPTRKNKKKIVPDTDIIVNDEVSPKFEKPVLANKSTDKKKKRATSVQKVPVSA